MCLLLGSFHNFFGGGFGTGYANFFVMHISFLQKCMFNLKTTAFTALFYEGLGKQGQTSLKKRQNYEKI